MAVDFDALTLPAVQDAFGGTCTWQRGAATLDFVGVPDRHGGTLSLSRDGAPISIRQVRIGVRLVDWIPTGTFPEQGDSVTVAGTTWKVMDVNPDGLGGAVLLLSGRSTSGDDRP